jgi:GNAT superfamily N-acetyltransferase
MLVNIRNLDVADRPAWERLWHGYVKFYRRRVDADVTDFTFARLSDPGSQPFGIIAADEAGRLLGIAHYLFRPTTWSRLDLCYLEDLYVDPGARGSGIGRSLINEVYGRADERGVSGVYWLTQEFNADGRALYDTLAKRTSFIRYQR